MAFNSLEYLGFFISILVISWIIVGFPKLRIWVILLASYYFYAANNGWLLVLILISTQIDFLAGKKIDESKDPRVRKIYLIISVVSNLGILGFFKYFNFFADSIVQLAHFIGYEPSWVDLNIILPVGISFYTFQTMAYTIDVYRKDIKAEQSWLRFSFFIAYFPQLVAGPIIRPADFLPQVNKKPKLSADNLNIALLYIAKGLFKKLVLADYLSIYVGRAFDEIGQHNSIDSLIGVYAFAFQIYFDFSGYSDVAIGCSKLLGFDIPENFRRPYMATSISDFWRRWHISLSQWLRDYLYISLGGNKMKTERGVQRNLMITMILGGLWHGAAWHFVLWGFLQGVFLVIERKLGIGRKKERNDKWSIVRAGKIFLTFHLVCLSWIVFRVEDGNLLRFLTGLFWFDLKFIISLGMIGAIGIISLGALFQFLIEETKLYPNFLKMPIALKSFVYACVIASITIFATSEVKPFIYFQF